MAEERRKPKLVSRGKILINTLLIEFLLIIFPFAVLKIAKAYYVFSFLERLLVIFGGLTLSGIVWFFLFYFRWAPNNLDLTFVKEGTGKIVVRGDAYKKTLIQWRGYDEAPSAGALKNPDGSIIAEWDEEDIVERGFLEKSGDLRPRKRILGVFRRSEKRFFGGLRLYGLWPLDDIYCYLFSWTNVLQSGETKAHIKEALDFFLLKEDVYWAVVADAEDKKLLPLGVELVLTIRIINPRKAVFIIQNWLEAVINRMGPGVRNIITHQTFEKWITSKQDLARAIFEDLATSGLLKEFKTRYGVEVRAVEVKNINPPKEQREVTLKKYVAEQDKKRIIVEAQAEARRIGIIAKARQQQVATVYSAVLQFGDSGKLLRTLEALEESPGKGARWVVTLPGMADFLSQVFPGRPVASLRPGEIRETQEIITIVEEVVRRLQGPAPSSSANQGTQGGSQ